jgi:hypothetical protein
VPYGSDFKLKLRAYMEADDADKEFKKMISVVVEKCKNESDSLSDYEESCAKSKTTWQEKDTNWHTMWVC